MKVNKIFLATALMLALLAMGIVVAEEVSLGDHSFEIPKGFEVLNSTDEMIVLTQDDDHVIVVMIPDAVKNSDDAKTYLEKQGYKFIAEETYTADGKEVAQQNYEKDGYKVMSYILPAGSDQCVVTYTIPTDEEPPEGADNPVTTILNSIH